MTGFDGDNIEFTADVIGDYTIYFSKDQDIEADTEFLKHPKAGNGQTARRFTVRTDKNADLTVMDNRTFTNPCQITADKPHIEKRNVPSVSWIVIRTLSTGTLIKVRWF
ncbi:hypothetical protein LCGC14_2746850 [marine sediment metagenome]|uniref:Uncharacterized protein n=1 Tax=marine sediment metagenome TaxID=412755 RepID=A0A0F8Z304_9ZZZZ